MGRERGRRIQREFNLIMPIQTWINWLFWLIKKITEVNMYKQIELFNKSNFRRPLFAFIKNGLFHFITLSKMAFIDDFCSIQKCHYEGFFTLSKTVFISLYQKRPFLPYCIIKRGLYQPLLKWPLSLYPNSLYWPLLKMALFALLLNRKMPLSAFMRIFCFIAL